MQATMSKLKLSVLCVAAAVLMAFGFALIAPVTADAVPSTPTFTATVGSNMLTNSTVTTDGYTYTDYYGNTTTVDLYTVKVPTTATKVDLSFSENVLAYNYDVDGSTWLDGNYPGDTYMVGANTASVKIDANDDGTSDIIQIQTPYDSSWNSDLLYAITFEPVTMTTTGTYDAYDKTTKTGGYTYTDYYGNETTVDLITCYVVKGTKTVTLNFSDNVLAYNYDVDGSTWIAGNYPGDTYMVGANKATVEIDANNDGTNDIIQIQCPYDSNWNSDLLYAVTFVEIPDIIDLGDNLAYRFLKKGTDAGINNMTVDAAIALNALKINGMFSRDDILAALEAAEKNGALSAGTLAKYALALSYAEVDCTCVEVNGVQRNLIDEICEGIEDCDKYGSGVYSYVYILPLLTDFNYDVEYQNAYINQMIKAMLNERDSDTGLFGMTNYYDSQTTAQAILALLPYANDPDVENAIELAVKTLKTMQCADGGFAYTAGSTSSNLDATCAICSALIAAGEEPLNMKVESGDSPYDYIYSKADSTMDGFNDATASNESMTAASALLALATLNQSISAGESIDPYKYNGVEAKTIAGSTRYETSAEIVNAELQELGAFEGVIIASADNYPDALSASALAGYADYPILLTKSTSLQPATEQALENMVSCNGEKLDILIIGGESAVSSSVEEALAAYDDDGEVDRISGSNRYATNDMINNIIVDDNTYGTTTVFVATGTNYADALAISPYAASVGAPIVLTNGKSFSYSAAQTLSWAKNVVVLGGTNAVSEDVYNQIVAQMGEDNVTRISGDNRYETCAYIVKYELEQGMSIENPGVATGANFPDALASGYLLGKTNGSGDTKGSVLLLLDPKSSKDGDIYDALIANAGDIKSITVFGGLNAVSQSARFMLMDCAD